MKFNSIVCVVLTAFVAASAFAAEELTEAEREARRYKRTGGQVLKPGTKHGTIAIINAQPKVTSKEIETVAANLRYKIGIDVVIKDGEKVDVLTAGKAKSAAKAEVAVFVIDDANLPVSIVAREERWGIVNVAKLDNGKLDHVRLYGRVKNEVMRVVAFVSGATDSQFKGSLMSIGDKPEDLDGAQTELPIDVMNKMAESLARIGVTPAEYGSFRRACKEGWGVPPTNDVQRAIWQEFNSKPTEPMKIEFDKTKGI